MAMEDEDDDFYDPVAPSSLVYPTALPAVPAGSGNEPQETRPYAVMVDQKMMDGLEEGEEKEVEESDDSDIDIITERKGGPKPEAPAQAVRQNVTRSVPSRSTPIPTSKESTIPVKTETPTKTTDLVRSGADFPALRTSKIDVDHVPLYQPVGKPLDEVDIDEDLKQFDKAWRVPGSDISDYFNYGFDEFTWTLYCLKQEKTRSQAQEDKTQFASGMMGGADGAQLGAPVLPPLPPAASQAGMNVPPPPGMPELPPEMQAMMVQMMASGMDPAQLAQMDPSAFGMAQAGTNKPQNFGNSPQPYGPQAQNVPQMPFGFDSPMGGVDPSRTRQGNFGGGRNRGSSRRNW